MFVSVFDIMPMAVHAGVVRVDAKHVFPFFSNHNVCRFFRRTKQTGLKRGHGSPSTPSAQTSAPGTPHGTLPGQEPPHAHGQGQGRKAKKAKVEEPLTALQKGRDMAGKLLKKNQILPTSPSRSKASPMQNSCAKKCRTFPICMRHPVALQGDFRPLALIHRHDRHV